MNAGRGIVAAIGLFLTVAIPASPTRGQSPALGLPAEAAQAMRLGLEAVQLKEWALALRYFTRAQRAAPRHPQALYNLARAYDLAGGRDLLAIAWYRAYLAVAPDASNTDEVRADLVRLEENVKATVGKLIHTARDLAEEVADRTVQDGLYRRIAVAEAATGEFDAARKTRSRIQRRQESDHAAVEIDALYQRSRMSPGTIPGDPYQSLSPVVRAYYRAGIRPKARDDEWRVWSHFAAVIPGSPPLADLQRFLETTRGLGATEAARSVAVAARDMVMVLNELRDQRAAFEKLGQPPTR